MIPTPPPDNTSFPSTSSDSSTSDTQPKSTIVRLSPGQRFLRVVLNIALSFAFPLAIILHKSYTKRWKEIFSGEVHVLSPDSNPKIIAVSHRLLSPASSNPQPPTTFDQTDFPSIQSSAPPQYEASAPSSAVFKRTPPQPYEEIQKQIRNSPPIQNEPTAEEKTAYAVEEAIHEIVPGLFLGGIAYSEGCKKIYTFDKTIVAQDDMARDFQFDQYISMYSTTRNDLYQSVNKNFERLRKDKPNAIYQYPADDPTDPNDTPGVKSTTTNSQALTATIQLIDRQLKTGKSVFVFCQQGLA